MASIYKRGGAANKNGVYYITYAAGAGVRRTVKACRDRAATEALARKLEADVFLRKQGVIDVKVDQYNGAEATPLVIRDKEENLVGGHVADFFNYLVAKANTKKHAEQRRSHVCRILDVCKAKSISQLTPSTVQSALQALRDGGLSPQTCNHYLRSIKQFSRWLWRDGRASEYTLAHLSGYNSALDRRHDRRALTDDELARLLAAAEKGPVLYEISGPDRTMLYRLAVGTGFRRNELRSLTPESFDLDGNPPTVTVEAAYSKHRRRDVQPIRRDLADLLRLWLATKEKGKPVIDTSEWNWHRTSEMMQVDLKAAEVSFQDERGLFADFHSLRHTYITNVGRSGASMKTHQELARHSEPSLTMRYTHTRLEDKVKALEALPAVNRTTASAPQNAVA